MVHTLRTDEDVKARPLDAICARQFIFDIEENWIRALLNAGYNSNRPPPLRSREALTEFFDVPALSPRYGHDAVPLPMINDLRDVAALAAAIPYCDVVVTDNKAWDTAGNRAHLDKEFNTVILRRLTDLAAQL